MSSRSRYQGLQLEETKEVHQKIENLSCVIESATNEAISHSTGEESQTFKTGSTSSPNEKKKIAKRLDFSESDISIGDGKSWSDFQMLTTQKTETKSNSDGIQECPGTYEFVLMNGILNSSFPIFLITSLAPSHSTRLFSHFLKKDRPLKLKNPHQNANELHEIKRKKKPHCYPTF